MKLPPKQDGHRNSTVQTGSPTARLLWLELNEERTHRGQILRNLFADIDMTVTNWGKLLHPSENWPPFDLILLQVANQSSYQVNEILLQIRTQSRAPVILLADRQVLEWSLTSLPAGADAVIGLNTADEVILARCQALLRRWFPAR